MPWSVIRDLDIEIKEARGRIVGYSDLCESLRQQLRANEAHYLEFNGEVTRERDRLVDSNEGLKRLVGDLQQMLSNRGLQ